MQKVEWMGGALAKAVLVGACLPACLVGSVSSD